MKLQVSSELSIKFVPRYYYKKGECKGVVVALFLGGTPLYGWSLCDPHDKYKRRLAINIAVGRALTQDKTPIPHSLIPVMSELQHRVNTADIRRKAFESQPALGPQEYCLTIEPDEFCVPPRPGHRRPSRKISTRELPASEQS